MFNQPQRMTFAIFKDSLSGLFFSATLSLLPALSFAAAPSLPQETADSQNAMIKKERIMICANSISEVREQIRANPEPSLTEKIQEPNEEALQTPRIKHDSMSLYEIRAQLRQQNQ